MQLDLKKGFFQNVMEEIMADLGISILFLAKAGN
jgi:hypothetical protein